MAWPRYRKLKEYEYLIQIGKNLDVFESPEADGYETPEKRDRIKQLESQRSKNSSSKRGTMALER